MPTFRKATPRDAFALAERLRTADREELEAAGSPSPQAALLSGLAPEGLAVTVEGDDDTPLMMFGVVPHPEEPLIGLVWGLASNAALKHRRMFLTDAPWWIERFQALFPILTNHTDCRNAEHHRWLRWCGFTFINKIDGPKGLPFYEFVRIRSPNV